MSKHLLSPKDLDVVERLLERPLPLECRVKLSELFGADGERAIVHRLQDEYASACDKDCYSCSVCQPFMEEPLLYLVVDTIKEYFKEQEPDCYCQAKF